jgi:transcriptional regulator with XRE-family HTH domain
LYKNKIREIRNSKSLTQIQLSKKLKITQSELSKIERKNDPPIDVVFNLAKLLNIPVTLIYSET